MFLSQYWNLGHSTDLLVGGGEAWTLQVRAEGSPSLTDRICPMESPSFLVGLTLAWGTAARHSLLSLTHTHTTNESRHMETLRAPRLASAVCSHPPRVP